MMKVFIALTLVALQGSICRSEDFRCEPNTSYKKDCNTCHCSENGKFAACTLMECFNTGQVSKCTPGEKKTEDCNHCICVDDKSWACTRRDCSVRSRRSPQSDDGKCVPGTRWTQECNDCWCTETGFAACTLRGCIRSDNPISRNAPKPVDLSDLKVFTEAEFLEPTFSCQPGEHFKVDCNNCKCGNGKQAKCTKKRCVPSEV